MRITMFLAVLAALLCGCNNRVEELERQTTSLQTSNNQLLQELASRDSYVDGITNAVNDIYGSIEDLKDRERSLLKETSDMESTKKLTRDEMRERLVSRINLIHETLRDNHERLAILESKLASSTKQYDGLKKMVANLKKSLEERDQSIASLGKQVDGLQQDVVMKTQMITQKDSVIGTQYRQITTAYYIAGTRDELEKMGIIKKEGGFLWGLVGSTTTLASGFDDARFKSINKELPNTIQVSGKINEIIPKRSEQFYAKKEVNGDQSMLTIAEPTRFWQDKYLVIITDRENTN